MTILALDHSVRSELQNDEVFQSSSGSRSKQTSGPHLPRINLRKRPVSTATTTVDRERLHTVNSAFLTGLFADVASIAASEPKTTEPNHATKKCRISKTKSISRCGQSYKILSEALKVCDSPNSANTTFFEPAAYELDRTDSLILQLNHVGSLGIAADASSGPKADLVSIAFPHLPATVSNSSCANLTRVLSDLQSSAAENSTEENYGWFVETDEDDPNSRIPLSSSDPYASVSREDLAFVAYTAPKADNHDDELEWAQAADTVDDVLGDFF